ncbi:hypothetical protein MMC14_008012 [Varicellaria rhodocarpa]|nr:hypothetical protein [Varicellaria rhodocarpa]
MKRPELLNVTSRLFGSMSYFTRLWIIQEVFQGNNLQFYCRFECLDWSILELFHSAVSALDIEVLGDSFDKLRRARRDFKTAGMFPSLDTAIEFSWDSECSDIRDKVYGILSITQGGKDFEINYNEDCEMLLVRALKYFSTPHISPFLEFSHKMVQLLELDYHKIYDYICASDFKIDFELTARLTVVWTPTTVKPSDTSAGIVCPKCGIAITFDENVSRLPLRVFSWCPAAGYDKRVRPTHVFFQHIYREQRPVPAYVPAPHTMIDRISALLGWLSVPFGPVKNLLNRSFPAMIYQTSQTTIQPLPETDPTEEHPPYHQKWRYLRAFGWKMSDYDGFDIHFFRLNTISPGHDPFAVIESNNSPKFFRGQYDASVIFSAAQMICFIFVVEKVPFDDEGWRGNYEHDEPASW